MSELWETDGMAQEMEEELGKCQILRRKVQEKS